MTKPEPHLLVELAQGGILLALASFGFALMGATAAGMLVGVVGVVLAAVPILAAAAAAGLYLGVLVSDGLEQRSGDRLSGSGGRDGIDVADRLRDGDRPAEAAEDWRR